MLGDKEWSIGSPITAKVFVISFFKRKIDLNSQSFGNAQLWFEEKIIFPPIPKKLPLEITLTTRLYNMRTKLQYANHNLAKKKGTQKRDHY